MLRLAARGTSNGEDRVVAGVVAALEGTDVVITASGNAPALVEIQIFDGEVLVASGNYATSVSAVDGAWPTGFVIVMEDDLSGVTSLASGFELGLITSNNIAGVTWSAPVRLSIDGGRPVEGDRVLIRHDVVTIDGGVNGFILESAFIDSVVMKNILTRPFHFSPPAP